MYRIIEKINRRVFDKARQNKAAVSLVAFAYERLLKYDSFFEDKLNDAVISYGDKSCDKKALRHDIMREFIRAWIYPSEYARFELFHKTIEERKEYIPDAETLKIFKKTKGNNILPDSKFDRYKLFKQYFRRQVLCVSANDESVESEYDSFVLGKEKVVVKPRIGTKGHGVAIVSVDEIPTFKKFEEHYGRDCLIEEVIDQGDEMKQFHPNSVNTVRFATGIDRSGVFHNLFALIRVGQGGSVVDNVGAGGLVALIDMNSGEICTDAYCGTTRYEFHPDTNLRFNGFRIPEWSALCSLVKEMHLSYDKQRVFGFDMAWTKNGWDLVEVNPAPSFDSYQELTGIGIRPYLHKLNML